ncbi:MAG TPA: hypothetical protein VM165_09590, partial [Planctomycetaceae bacterium]|nr:hypothetical protein [Planctomycetaceae bacterium]
RLARVVAVEATEEFRDAREQSERRRAAGREAAARRRQATRDWVQILPITISVMSWDALVMRACASYNGHQQFRPGGEEWTTATPTSDQEFLERIAVNYLRHETSSYDAFLDRAQGRTGVHEARLEIKRRVLRAIASAYPELAAECDRQAERAEANYRDVPMPGRPGSAGGSLAG